MKSQDMRIIDGGRMALATQPIAVGIFESYTYTSGLNTFSESLSSVCDFYTSNGSGSCRNAGGAMELLIKKQI